MVTTHTTPNSILQLGAKVYEDSVWSFINALHTPVNYEGWWIKEGLSVRTRVIGTLVSCNCTDITTTKLCKSNPPSFSLERKAIPPFYLCFPE